MPTASIQTLGCKVNQFESAGLAEILGRSGYELAAWGQPVDLTVINTCTVTHRADFESRGLIRRSFRISPDGLIVVTGCLAQLRPEELAALPGVCLALGNEHKHELAGFLPGLVKGAPAKIIVSQARKSSPVRSFGFPEFNQTVGRTRVFFRIQDGCSARCSYCTVPDARGPSRSMDEATVRRGLEVYRRMGYAEAVLTGIHLGVWGEDLVPAKSLVELLSGLELSPTGLRLRLSSIEPREVSPELIGGLKDLAGLCPHVHLPLQSGDNGVLARMGRPYTAAFFEELVMALAAVRTDLAVGADVMVGFPGEDERAWQNTAALLERLPLAYLHVFPFSRRPGTPAADMPGMVDPVTIKRRAAALRALGQAKRRSFQELNRGLIRLTLIENTRDRSTGLTRGLTDNYLTVLLREEAPAGRIVPVRLTDGGSDHKMSGRLV